MAIARIGIRAALIVGCVVAGRAYAQSGDSAVAERLDSIRLKHNVPALGAAFIRRDGSITFAVVGVRKRGTDLRATIEDQWLLGSNTKAMTATLLATFVEQGALTWETTLAELFPELRARFRGNFGAITVTHLLTHYAGLDRDLNWSDIRHSTPAVTQQRLNSVRKAGSKRLRSLPGTKMEYSNLGYVIAGAVAERVGGKSWEALIRERVFTSLGMSGCGFGGPGTPGQLDQPWPHNPNGNPGGPRSWLDVEDVVAPAGRVRCSLADWAKFLLDQLRGANGKGALLKSETYTALHEARFGGTYAFGWSVASAPWADGVVLNHTGSNGMNFCFAWIAPARDVALLAVTNRGGDAGGKATVEASEALIRLYGLVK
ncbi:MAG TPA: serine hydrolase domain-containing protein [Vicinamibacterales bacterium]|nr:serine hydrolase domain-containing protein [Vicinamibacterales bacterium]